MNAFSPPADTGSLSLNAVRKGLVNSLRTFQAFLLSCDAGLSLEVGTSEGKILAPAVYSSDGKGA